MLTDDKHRTPFIVVHSFTGIVWEILCGQALTIMNKILFVPNCTVIIISWHESFGFNSTFSPAKGPVNQTTLSFYELYMRFVSPRWHVVHTIVIFFIYFPSIALKKKFYPSQDIRVIVQEIIWLTVTSVDLKLVLFKFNLGRIQDWCTRNVLLLNIDKCQALTFIQI